MMPLVRQRDLVIVPWENAARHEGWEVDGDGIYWAAVDGLAWSLLEQTMDTADREPSPDDHAAARATAERLVMGAGQFIAALLAARVECPVHGIPDCSPLLNGCSIPRHIAEWRGRFIGDLTAALPTTTTTDKDTP